MQRRQGGISQASSGQAGLNVAGNQEVVAFEAGRLLTNPRIESDFPTCGHSAANAVLVELRVVLRGDDDGLEVLVKEPCQVLGLMRQQFLRQDPSRDHMLEAQPLDVRASAALLVPLQALAGTRRPAKPQGVLVEFRERDLWLFPNPVYDLLQ